MRKVTGKNGNLVESEGVLMIITAYGIIVFQLVLWIGIVSKSSKAVYKESKDMLAFSYLAIPTRHEVSEMPMDL